MGGSFIRGPDRREAKPYARRVRGFNRRSATVNLRTAVRLYTGPMTTNVPSLAACSLDAEGLATRAAGLRAMLAPNVRAVRRSGARAEIDLALDAAGERALSELLDLERECCPFWRFSLARRPGGLVRLGVRAESPHEAALDAFLTFTLTLTPARP